jgi:predicted RNase H-like HicB family nuclease
MTTLTYDLHLESGPKRKETMVHVFDLLGCVAVGPTTEEALDGTPEAIRAFKRFLNRHGEQVDPDERFELRVAQHVTEGEWLGNGSPYIAFDADFLPLSDPEVDRYVERLRWMDEELAAWAATQEHAALDVKPAAGRTNRGILLHVLGAQGPVLSAALASAPGFGKIQGAAERGEIPLAEAFHRAADLVAERIAATTPEQRNAVRELTSRSYTLRKALRRTLEHAWEHYAELSRRPGGPEL